MVATPLYACHIQGMPERSSKPKRPRDVSQRAKLIVDIAMGDAEDRDKFPHEGKRQHNSRLGDSSLE